MGPGLARKMGHNAENVCVLYVVILDRGRGLL